MKRSRTYALDPETKDKRFQDFSYFCISKLVRQRLSALHEKRMSDDEKYMQRCLQLAANGLGRTRPNPLVGCVVVKEGQIISEGFHQRYGQNHAERNALLRLSQKQAHGSTLYVNLEPCSHFGHTPPCADLIIEKGITKVVCCNDDPNPLVSGNGFAKLEAAGIKVVRHVLEAEGLYLNRRFFTYIEKGRPYIILKWAETIDGFMAPDKHSSTQTLKCASTHNYWISTPAQTRLSHKWRTEESAILVGSQTYIDDRPQLTARLWAGENPVPIVLDRRKRLTDVPEHWMHLDSNTVEQAVSEIHQAGLQSLIVEGGRKILEAFLQAGLYDEIQVFRSHLTFGSGLAAPSVPADRSIPIKYY